MSSRQAARFTNALGDGITQMRDSKREEMAKMGTLVERTPTFFKKSDFGTKYIIPMHDLYNYDKRLKTKSFTFTPKGKRLIKQYKSLEGGSRAVKSWENYIADIYKLVSEVHVDEFLSKKENGNLKEAALNHLSEILADEVFKRQQEVSNEAKNATSEAREKNETDNVEMENGTKRNQEISSNRKRLYENMHEDRMDYSDADSNNENDDSEYEEEIVRKKIVRNPNKDFISHNKQRAQNVGNNSGGRQQQRQKSSSNNRGGEVNREENNSPTKKIRNNNNNNGSILNKRFNV